MTVYRAMQLVRQYAPTCIVVCLSCLFNTVVDCGTLSDPVNGQVSFSSTTYNSVATYTCSIGILQGDSSRICQADGSWSGSEPFCLSELEHCYGYRIPAGSSMTCILYILCVLCKRLNCEYDYMCGYSSIYSHISLTSCTFTRLHNA